MIEKIKPPVWYWIVAVVALLWNLMGVFQYIAVAYMTDEMAAEMPADQQAYYADMPAWVTAAFAIAVFGGAIGSLFLMFRKKIAERILIVSFVSVLAQMTYNLFIAESTVAYGPGQVVMAISIPLFALALIVLARGAKNKGWMG